MNAEARTRRSEYMVWAKTHSRARFNLATSGVQSVTRTEFSRCCPATDLEINPPHGDYGYAPLQERLARHTGAPVECVVAAAGTSMANHLAMAALLAPGDEVLMEEPTYGPLLDVAGYLGARVRRFTRRADNGFALEPEEIEKCLTPQTRLIVLCNLHNPSGALVPEETLRRVGELARGVGARVLVDEVYLEMLFENTPPFAFPIGHGLGTAEENPFIVTSSLTKAYGLSGLRCGWILAAPRLARQMWQLNDLFAATAAHPAEGLSIVALDRLSAFRERARMLLQTNRVLLDAFLDARRGDLECFRPQAGTVIFPRVLRGETESFLHLLREKYETSVVPGKFFEVPGHFRVGIGGDTATLRGGLERLNDALDEFGR